MVISLVVPGVADSATEEAVVRLDVVGSVVVYVEVVGSMVVETALVSVITISF